MAPTEGFLNLVSQVGRSAEAIRELFVSRFSLVRLALLILAIAIALWLVGGLGVPHTGFVIAYLGLAGVGALLIRGELTAGVVVLSMLLLAGLYGLVTSSV